MYLISSEGKRGLGGWVGGWVGDDGSGSCALGLNLDTTDFR